MREKINSSGGVIPLNPTLPDHFFDRDHAERSAAEIKQWWNVPFIQTMKQEGTPEKLHYAVFCLDGGEEDSPTQHGACDNLEQARGIAFGLIRALLYNHHTPSF